MADDLLNPSLPPVSWTTGTAARENRREPSAGKNVKAGKKEKITKPSPPALGEAGEQIETDDHELDSFA